MSSRICISHINSEEDIVNIYKNLYPRWENLETEIDCAFRISENHHDLKTVRNLWKNGEITTLTRDITITIIIWKNTCQYYKND